MKTVIKNAMKSYGSALRGVLSALFAVGVIFAVCGNDTAVSDNRSGDESKGVGIISTDHSQVNKVDIADTGSLIHCRTTIGCMLPNMKCHNILRFRENYASQSANQFADLFFATDDKGNSAYDGVVNMVDWTFTTVDLVATVLKETGLSSAMFADKILEVAAAFEKMGNTTIANHLLAEALTKADLAQKIEFWNKYGGWIQAAISGVECAIDVSRSNTDDEKVRAIAQLVGSISANHLATVITDLMIAAALSIPAVASAFAAAPVAVTVGIIAVSAAVGWAFGALVKHGIDHPEDNAFAIFINWFYDHSLIPAKISEWWYDVRYGDILHNNGYADMVNWFYDNTSLPEMLSNWWYDMRYKGKILQERDDKKIDYEQHYEFIPSDELSQYDDDTVSEDPFDSMPESNQGSFGDDYPGRRYQGLKPLHLID